MRQQPCVDDVRQCVLHRCVSLGALRRLQTRILVRDIRQYTRHGKRRLSGLPDIPIAAHANSRARASSRTP